MQYYYFINSSLWLLNGCKLSTKSNVGTKSEMEPSKLEMYTLLGATVPCKLEVERKAGGLWLMWDGVCYSTLRESPFSLAQVTDQVEFG